MLNPWKRPKLWYLKQVTFPRCTPGIDHGADAKILVANGDRVLLWRGGCKYFAGIGMQSYAESQLTVRVIRPNGITSSDGYRNIVEGGRLSADLIRDHIGRVNELLETDLKARDIRIRETLVLRQTVIEKQYHGAIVIKQDECCGD